MESEATRGLADVASGGGEDVLDILSLVQRQRRGLRGNNDVGIAPGRGKSRHNSVRIAGLGQGQAGI